MRTANVEDMFKWIADEYFDLQKVTIARERRGSRIPEVVRDSNTCENGFRGRKGKSKGRGGATSHCETAASQCEPSGGQKGDEGNGSGSQFLIHGQEVIITQEEHNQIHENVALCLQRLALSQLFPLAVRERDTRALLQCLNMLTVFFHGTRNNKYGAELLEQTIDRKLK